MSHAELGGDRCGIELVGNDLVDNFVVFGEFVMFHIFYPQVSQISQIDFLESLRSCVNKSHHWMRGYISSVVK